MSGAYPEPGVRRFITAATMAATVMNSLDATIANVALPHIQGSVSASAEEITWVLTSYIVASAIFTPLTGWLAARLGRSRLMMASIVGFTIASGLCGLATGLDELVGFRLLQGAFGAALVPMSQAILLDINPPERHAKAMAIWSMGAVVGPIVGPSLGGLLTDNLSWRWVFFINLPVGTLAFLGILFFLRETRSAERVRFDLFGFTMMSLAIGCLQLMLDRGQTQDWFASTEICLEAGGAVLFGYLFIVHMLTAERPFLNPSLFLNRNFTLSCLFGFFLAMSMYTVLALLPPVLENLMGYPVLLTGLVTAPRGLGSLLVMIVVGQFGRRIDPRLLVAAGFLINGLATYSMSGFSLGMDRTPVMVGGLVQGLGTGLVFAPLSLLAFATIEPWMRNEGAAIFTLVRNLGGGIGIAVMQALTTRNAAAVHARLVEGIRPDNPLLAQAVPGFDFAVPAAIVRMNAEITRQAAMVAYTDTFWLLSILSLSVVPLPFLLRASRRFADATPIHMD